MAKAKSNKYVYTWGNKKADGVFNVGIIFFQNAAFVVGHQMCIRDR